ncbi:MAG: cyclic nucleotide-binding domain-containing protein [Candidatus Sericytochromatia bacterium]
METRMELDMDELLRMLREGKGWSEETLQTHLKRWEKERQQRLEPIAGERLVFEPTGHLVWLSFPEGEELARLPLWQLTPEGRIPSRQVAWLNPRDGRLLSHRTLHGDSRPSLILSAEHILLHAPELEKAPELGAVTGWLDTAFEAQYAPQVDLSVSPDQEFVLVSHRKAGEVVLCSIPDRQELARWSLRQPGFQLAFNTAWDVERQELYLSDNLSAQLWIVDLDDLNYRVWQGGLGTLGNLATAVESGKLYLSVLKPQFSLLYFDLENMAPDYSVEIKGQSWVNEKLLPQDPLLLSPDGKFLHMLTWTLQEGRQTPVMNVIDAKEVVALRRYPLKEGLRPIQLAYPVTNPFPAFHSASFEDYLLRHGLIQPADLEAPPPSPVALEPTPKARKRPQVQRNFHIYQPPKEDAGLWEQIDQPGASWELPLAAEDAIVDLLNWAFYRLTLTNLRIHADEMKRLQRMARSIREELKSKEVVLAQLEDVLGEHRFQTPISRQAVMELLQQGKLQGEFMRLEDLCPLCQAPLEEGVCTDCEFRVTLPEGMALSLDSVSAEPSSTLFPGQLLLPHPGLNALLTLNLWRQPLHRLNGQDAEVKQLAHAVALPNHNFLVTDRLGNRVSEVSPSGEVIWKARLALKQPVMATFTQAADGLHILLVDQGNQRVLELDQSGRHWRRYPGMKTADADKLTTPTDVMLTPSGSWLISDPGAGRVLEVAANSTVIARFGAEHGLKAPFVARRQADGSTEILDRELGTCFRFDATGTPCGQFVYWPPPSTDVERWRNTPTPHWACRIHNGEWLLVSEQALMLMAPALDSLRWIMPLPDPLSENALLKVRFQTRSGADVRKLQLAEYTALLKQSPLLAQEKDEALEALARHVQMGRVNTGDWLVRPDDVGNGIYFVIEGELELVAPEDDLPVVMSIRSGEICGQQVVVSEEQNWKPGLRAKGETRLLMLDRGEFKKVVVFFPRLFQIVRQVDHEHQRQFKYFRERKTEALQDHLRSRIAESRVRTFPLFAHADTAFFEALADCVHAVAFLPDQEVCTRLESGGSLWLIFEGEVGILRKGETQPEITLGEGELFGEMALISDQPRSATVRTLSYCKFFEMDLRHVKSLCLRFPWFKRSLEELAASRAADNQGVVDAFEARAGLQRADLPQVTVMPQGLRQGETLFYAPSLHHDALSGINLQGEVMWFWGRDSERQLFQPTRAQRTAHNTLIVADTGHDRLLEIDLATREVLRKWGEGLERPRSGALTPEGFLLVADEGHQRLVVMDEKGKIAWEYGLPEEILKPSYAELTPEGHILFADAGMHKVYELTREGQLLWSHGKWRNAGSTPEQLDSPEFVQRLEDGSTLVADTGNQRLVWLRPDQDTLVIPLQHLGEGFFPRHCEVLDNQEWLVFDAHSDRLVKVGRRGEEVWTAQFSYPALGVPVEMVKPKSMAERWVLDLDRLGPLPEAEVSPPPSAGTPLSWEELGIALSTDAPALTPLDTPEEAPSELLAELDAALEITHGEALHPEPAPADSAPLAPEYLPELADLLDELGTGTVIVSPSARDPLPAEALGPLGDEFDEIFGDAPDTAAVPAAAPALGAWDALAFLEEGGESISLETTLLTPQSAPEANSWDELAFLDEVDAQVSLASTLLLTPESDAAESPEAPAANPWGDLAFLEDGPTADQSPHDHSGSGADAPAPPSGADAAP